MFLKTAISFIFIYLLFFGGINTEVYTAPDIKPTQKASSTIASIATSTKPAIKSVKTSTTTPKAKITPVKTAIEAPKTETKPEPAPDFIAINEFARKATVNILCTAKGGELSPISGTGAIVEPNGLILTNAHIGQYLLLRNYREKDFIQCVARTGSPAYPKYNLELVYISPTWVAENKAQLKDQNPQGTGENDFAFLRISGMVDSSQPPETFPFVTMNIREAINVNEPVLLSSYPAGFLGGLSILQNLNITTAITNVQDVFTFRDGTIDIVSVGGTVVSQKGSSGGLVVDKNSTLIGVISTSSNGDTTSSRGLNAITLGYINRAMQKELGFGFIEFLSQTPESFGKTFASTTAPLLTKIITDELNKQ